MTMSQPASAPNLGESMVDEFEHINLTDFSYEPRESIQQRIERVTEDLGNLKDFYNIGISPTRRARLAKYYEAEFAGLEKEQFDDLDQQGKVDYLLLKNYLESELRQLDLDAAKNAKVEGLLSFAPIIVQLCEDRQQMKPIDGKLAAQTLSKLAKEIEKIQTEVLGGKDQGKVDKFSAFRAAGVVNSLRSLLKEWFGFFKGYDPLFSWWVGEPYRSVDKALERLYPVIRQKLVGIEPGDDDAIVGEPIGRDGLLHDLDVEKIPYTPEELINIANVEYEWCETEMKKAANSIGFGDDWRQALEYVKNLYVEPGKQPGLVRNLAVEATEYVKKHDLVTVPEVCEETYRMFMMSPARQKVNPFFLGGEDIIVSYPTDSMDHEAKLMSLRGNNVHFARATVFHEMIPGHHLQLFMNARHRAYRQLFDTPFSVEGWAFYWEMVLWDKETWVKTAENRIGMLFWRMHRCARIIFSLKFHLGQMTPQECIDLLVEWVGHERATAEGEVRRSFNGDYRPLYQVGYMIGGLQLYALRKELVDTGVMTEKQFHDRRLRENEMPIELLRALFKDQPLTENFKSSWKFYGKLQS